MLNHIDIMGRLTREPELKQTASGTAVCSFSVACERDRSANGADKVTDFIDVTAWRGTAEFISKYFTKGSMIVVSGRLQIREWTDKDNSKRRNAEVLAESVYFGGGSKSDGAAMPKTTEPTQTTTQPFTEISDEDGDLPF